jgi:hypothetical protein
MLTVLAGLAEFERHLILARTSEVVVVLKHVAFNSDDDPS